MFCTVLVGPPGCGKTERLHDDMLSSKRRWLLALPRTELIDEQERALSAKAVAERTAIALPPVHSKQDEARGKVARRVEQALKNHRHLDHAVVLVTHHALLDLDPKLLKGWSVAIDELPERATASSQFAASTIWSTLAALYELWPVGMDGRWWIVVPRDRAALPTPGEAINDASADALGEFHRCVRAPGRAVYVDLGDWQEARSTRRRVRWYSCWTPEALLQHAASVQIAGANVIGSLVERASQHAPSGPIRFVPVPVGAPRTGRPKVVIHYYTRHEGSTAWWGRDQDGGRYLVAISRHLERVGFDGYWSGNDEVVMRLQHRFPGQQVSPKQAGTNGLRHHRRCAFFYSNKAQAADGPVIEALGLDREDIRRAREDEDIVQFIFRGALRNGDFAGTYEVHLYNQQQAEMVAAYLVAKDITEDVTLVPEWDAGIMEVKRPGPNVGEADAAEIDGLTRAQRQERRREKARERSQRNRDRNAAEAERNGMRRRPGRPRKVA